MKRMKMVLTLLIIIGIVSTSCSVAEAAENEIEIVHVGRTEEILSDDEFAMISQGQIGGNVSQSMALDSSYTVHRYTDTFEFYLNGVMVARAEPACIVWHYTDGKVHLYSRTIGVYRLAHYDAARVYGSIVNTDGSYSYTTGDRVHLFLDQGTWVFAIDFYVSNTEVYFSCYEV